VGVAPYAKQLDTCTRQAPAGFALLGGDCDDADPARWQSAALDADADGFVESATVACLGELPTGYITRFDSDCNDADGAVWKIYHRDADGDGFGADGLDSEICAGAGAPNGYVALKPDCDDGDALRNHLAADQWGDGVDSDCNGDDDPFACSSDGFECPCSAFDVPPTLGELSCDDAPDLGLILLQRCLLCGPETVLVRVVNTGAQLSGPIRISVQLTPTTDGRSTDIPPPPIAASVGSRRTDGPDPAAAGLADRRRACFERWRLLVVERRARARQQLCGVLPLTSVPVTYDRCLVQLMFHVDLCRNLPFRAGLIY
jgi:hypothetical protein